MPEEEKDELEETGGEIPEELDDDLELDPEEDLDGEDKEEEEI